MPWSVVFMVIAILTIVTIGRVSKERYRALGREGARPIGDAELAGTREEIRKLKERIQVLERVITDDRKSIDLDREIERLRER